MYISNSGSLLKERRYANLTANIVYTYLYHSVSQGYSHRQSYKSSDNSQTGRIPWDNQQVGISLQIIL